jgi:ferredoxin
MALRFGLTACEDTSHLALAMKPGRVFDVIDAECVACNLCVNVCPVEDFIRMEELPLGALDPRAKRAVSGHGNWTQHPDNPSGGKAAEEGSTDCGPPWGACLHAPSTPQAKWCVQARTLRRQPIAGPGPRQRSVTGTLSSDTALTS